MNLRVKSIEIVNFLNPLYNRYRSYVSSWKLMSNYAREGKERLKYWWKKKEKKKNHPGCTSFLFLLEFPFSTNNHLFIANLPRIGRMIHRLEPTAFKRSRGRWHARGKRKREKKKFVIVKRWLLFHGPVIFNENEFQNSRNCIILDSRNLSCNFASCSVPAMERKRFGRWKISIA